MQWRTGLAVVRKLSRGDVWTGPSGLISSCRAWACRTPDSPTAHAMSPIQTSSRPDPTCIIPLSSQTGLSPKSDGLCAVPADNRLKREALTSGFVLAVDKLGRLHGVSIGPVSRVGSQETMCVPPPSVWSSSALERLWRGTAAVVPLAVPRNEGSRTPRKPGDMIGVRGMTIP